MKLLTIIAIYMALTVLAGAMNIYAWVFTFGWMNLLLYSLGFTVAYGATFLLAWRWGIK